MIRRLTDRGRDFGDGVIKLPVLITSPRFVTGVEIEDDFLQPLESIVPCPSALLVYWCVSPLGIGEPQPVQNTSRRHLEAMKPNRWIGARILVLIGIPRYWNCPVPTNL